MEQRRLKDEDICEMLIWGFRTEKDTFLIAPRGDRTEDDPIEYNARASKEDSAVIANLARIIKERFGKRVSFSHSDHFGKISYQCFLPEDRAAIEGLARQAGVEHKQLWGWRTGIESRHRCIAKVFDCLAGLGFSRDEVMHICWDMNPGVACGINIAEARGE